MSTTDQEQIQLLKSWWKSHGYRVLFVIIAVLLLGFGWRHWRMYSHNYLERTSTIYMQMLFAHEQNKVDEYKSFARQLISDYPGSVYSSLASLLLAKGAVDDGDFKAAEDNLRFIIKKSPAKILRQIARLRVAKLLIETQRYDAALQLLQRIDDRGYLADINEITADALEKLGRKEEARELYGKAKELGKLNAMQSPLLEVKLRQF